MPTKRDSRAPHKQSNLTRHEMAIRMLINSDLDIHRNGFKKAATALWNELAALDEYGPDDAPKIEFLPDAYKIDRENETLHLYEVEDSHPIPVDKLRKLAWYWFLWDCEGHHEWSPALHIVDRYGTITATLDLCRVYYATMLDEHRPAA